MSENNRKDFDMEEDPFAGVPDFDPALGWGDEEIYDLVLSARDISCLEGRTDISADDWLDATYHFDFEGKHEKAALCLTKAAELGNDADTVVYAVVSVLYAESSPLAL